MKLFHNENGRDVVYVQIHDIFFISNETDITIPESIITKVFSNVTIVDCSNRFDFVRFDEDSEVAFFKKLDFIIDYDDYKDLTDKQLNEKYQKAVEMHNSIATKFNSMPLDLRDHNMDLRDKHAQLKHMFISISDLYELKHGNISMPFPEFVKK